MALPERVYKFTDRPMSWTRAILTGLAIWVIVIILLGQLPSWIIYKADQSVSSIIEFSAKLPLVNDEGLNPKQIEMLRDVVANSVQMGALVVMLIVAYLWQEKKRKRTG